MSEPGDFGRALLVACDISSYGSGDDVLQLDKQRGLAVVLDEAAAAARLVRSSWQRNDRGDGELALLPDSESEPRVIDDFIHQLSAALARFNRNRIAQAQLRLRVAIHYGVAYPADSGYAGQGLVTVSRLLDSEPIRFALRNSTACLALILSDGVYRETVLNGHTSVAPNEFRKVSIQVKEYHADAWLWLPANAVHELPFSEHQHPADAPAQPIEQPADLLQLQEGTPAAARAQGESASVRPPEPAPQAIAHQVFTGDFHNAGNPVFGVSIDNRRGNAD
jgi:hypothetical protein